MPNRQSKPLPDQADAPAPTVVSFAGWWRSWKVAAEALVAAIDPTIGPVYILDFSESGIVGNRDKVGTGGCRGFTFPGFAARMRRHLERAGAWRGDGFALALDMNALADLNAEAILLHELAHHIVNHKSWLHAVDEDPDLPARVVDNADKPATIDVAMTPEEESAEPWRGHGWDFHRLLAHVVYRANTKADWPGWLALTIRCDYLLRSPADYAAALGREPEELAALSLAEVDAIDPPASFLKFAAADLQAAQLLHAERVAKSVLRPEIAAAMEGPPR